MTTRQNASEEHRTPSSDPALSTVQRRLHTLTLLIIPLILIGFDLLIMFVLYNVLYIIRITVIPRWFPTPEMIPLTHALRLFPLFAVPWTFFLMLEGIYSERISRSMEVRHLLKAGTRAILFEAFFILLTRSFEVVSRFMFFSFNAILPLLLFLSHRIPFYTRTLLSRFQRPMVLIGTGEPLKTFIEDISRRIPPSRLTIYTEASDRNRFDRSIHFLHKPSELEEFLNHASPPADVILVNIPPSLTLEKLERLVLASGGDIYLYPERTTFFTLTSDVEIWDGVPFVHTRNNLNRPLNRWIKRSFDLLITFTLLPLLIPLSALIALMIWLDSGRPIIFSHTRIGKNGKIFPCYKFRTMYQDADRRLREILAQNPEAKHEWEAFHKLKGKDPRITPIGRILRRLSLDEIPQFWNVLRGEMSLVGPRPYAVDEQDRLMPYFDLITGVRPGITGLWQVSGRSEKTFDERVELDLFYIRNWDLWLDAEILLRTVWVVLTGKGAY